MHTLYDTRAVRPLDRYEHFRAGTASELVPVSVHGRSPGHLLAVMSVAQIGDFAIETVTWATDREIIARRTERLIRASDPECYRIFLSVAPGVRIEQADHRVDFRARDIALHDISRPWKTTLPTASHPGGSRRVRMALLRVVVSHEDSLGWDVQAQRTLAMTGPMASGV
jgi:AraC-binding-like domain